MANTINRAAVMRRAWAIFRETYQYPSIPFKSIGRKCFAWAMKQAWAEVKEAARVAAIPADAKAARIETLQAAIEREYFNEQWQSASFRIESMRAEIRQLSA